MKHTATSCLQHCNRQPLWSFAQSSFACLILSTACCFAEDWKLQCQERFDAPGWEKQWTFSGSGGDVKAGGLHNASGELTATLVRQFDAPAIRVEYDAT